MSHWLVALAWSHAHSMPAEFQRRSFRMRRNAAKIMADGRAVNWLGANFWSRTGGPLMWRNYDAQTVLGELRVLREHGLAVTRSFFYWPDFMPEPDRIDEELTARFADFLDRHAEMGMQTIPTFVVGHMSGENWDPSWRQGRDLYSDVWMVARQAWFAGEMVRRFAAHQAVCGWLITNEMPIYGGEGPRETIAAWSQIMVDAVRAAGGTQPVSLGDGAWGIEISGQDTGFSVADSARLCDFIGPHIYPVGTDQARQHYAAAWACELATTYGRPVVLEEFGVSSDFSSDENAAHYYRQALHNSLLAGATGWLGWCNSDYDDLIHQDPYRHHAFELHFGLTDSRGRPKPQLAEMKAFADVLAAADIAHCERADSQTALIVPAHLDTSFPFTDPGDRIYLAEALHQAYVSARLADLAPAVTRESAGVAPGARLYLLPSAKHLLSPTCYDLERLAGDGATVYASYSAGGNDNHPGPWYSRLGAMFGIRHELRNGLVDTVPGDQVTFTFARDFGAITAGARLTFSVAGPPHGRAYLPVRPDGAEVVAVDPAGRPALLVRRTGAGSLVLCTYPIEHMAAATPGVNPEATSVLYDALAVHAGVSRPVTVEDPRVAADTLVHQDGTRLLWLVSQAAEPVAVKPQLAAGLRLCALDGGAANGAVTIASFGVSVFRLASGE
jgi:endo-1,4-beta-mannosidase